MTTRLSPTNMFTSLVMPQVKIFSHAQLPEEMQDT
jgi:hypothetical protein